MAALDAIQIPTVGFYDLDQVSGFHLEAIFANDSSSMSLRPHEYPTRIEKPLMRKMDSNRQFAQVVRLSAHLASNCPELLADMILIVVV